MTKPVRKLSILRTTRAAQLNTKGVKERIGAVIRSRARVANLPPVTDEEAARLVAEHIAKRGVTRIETPQAPPGPMPVFPKSRAVNSTGMVGRHR